MLFTLSKRSIKRLEGTDPLLSAIVQRALTLSEIDFGVSQGRRSLEEQKALLAKGATQTLLSKHLNGMAVDLFAYFKGKMRWEINFYDPIAKAMRQASREKKCTLRWGGAWHIDNITQWPDNMQKAREAYIDLCYRQKRKPFIDAPHFELVKD